MHEGRRKGGNLQGRGREKGAWFGSLWEMRVGLSGLEGLSFILRRTHTHTHTHTLTGPLTGIWSCRTQPPVPLTLPTCNLYGPWSLWLRFTELAQGWGRRDTGVGSGVRRQPPLLPGGSPQSCLYLRFRKRPIEPGRERQTDRTFPSPQSMPCPNQHPPHPPQQAGEV